MITTQKQMLVFTGLDGDMIDPGPEGIQVILPALELLRSRDVPHIIATVRSAAEILPTLQALDHYDPFIVEAGAAIYIPKDRFKINFPHQKTIGDYKVVELGTSRDTIREKLAVLRHEHNLEVVGLSELEPDQAAGIIGLSPAEYQNATRRDYSEAIIFNGEADGLARLQSIVEIMRLRLARHDHIFVLTGDHDQGSAVSFLLQLYREEYPDLPLCSIGLGDNILNAPLLYTVDTPILVRRPGGRFDDRVGRHGMKFTREPGPLGWSQAVIALVTEDPEA